MSLYVIVWGGKAKYCRKGIIKKIFDIEELEKSHVHTREKQQSLLTIADVLFQYETAQINIQYH